MGQQFRVVHAYVVVQVSFHGVDISAVVTLELFVVVQFDIVTQKLFVH